LEKTLFAEAIRVFFHYCYEHTAMLGTFASITEILEAIFNGYKLCTDINGVCYI